MLKIKNFSVANAARKLDRSDANTLREIGNYLSKRGEFIMATSIFTQIQDYRAIVRMHVEAKHWEDVIVF